MNDLSDRKGKDCFLLVPGFSPDDFPVIGLKETLESEGYDAFPTNFFGNIDVRDFSDLRISDCLESLSGIIDSLSKSYERVFGVGISLGGALLLEYAKRNHRLSGIASIGTPFRLKHQKLIAFGRFALPAFYPVWRHLQNVKRLRLIPLGSAAMVIDYLEGGFLRDLDKISTPTLLMHSRKDGVSDYEALEEYVPAIGSTEKKVVFFKNGNHVMSYNPVIVTEMLKFMKP